MGQAIADGSPLGQAMVAARRGPVTRIGHCRLCAEGLLCLKTTVHNCHGISWSLVQTLSQDMADNHSYIGVETKYAPPLDPTLPALALQVTRLLDSYMLWIGTTEEQAEDVRNAPLQGHLARDWACAMPASKVSSDEMLSGDCCRPQNWLIGRTS